MRVVGKSYWMGVATDTDRSKANVLSWFSPLCDNMALESAEILCDIETDREKKIRAVMIDENGKRYIAERTRGGRNFSISLKAA